MTARGSADDRETALRCGTEQRHAAGVGVDDARCHRDARCQAEVRRRSLGQRARSRTQGAHLHRHSRQQIEQVHRGQQRLAEPLFVRQVVPLAGEGADACHVGAGRAPHQIIRKIEVALHRRMALGEMPLQPKYLRQFHLDADLATDIGERLVVRPVDVGGLGDGAMVHPHDDVALGICVLGHRDAAPIGTNGDQRTGGVEADTADRGGAKPAVRDGLTHCVTELLPDVARRLLEHIAARIELLDRPHDVGQPITAAVENRGTHAARTDIHADERTTAHVTPSRRRRSGQQRFPSASRA